MRLGLAARGGRFVFTRGGLAAEPDANEWKQLLERQPIAGWKVLAAVVVASAAAILPVWRTRLSLAVASLLSFLARAARAGHNAWIIPA